MSSAGDLNVKLTASTGEFVGGMAAAQRSIDNVSRGAQKGRAALAGLGGALRMPGLSRGAAFGGFASNAASALGLGALAGGAAGIAGTLVFSGVTAFIDILKESNRRATEAAEGIREYDAALAKNQQTVAGIIDQIRIDAGPNPERANKEAALRNESASRNQELISRRNEILRTGIGNPANRAAVQAIVDQNPNTFRDNSVLRNAGNSNEQVRQGVVALAAGRGVFEELRNIEGALEDNADVLRRGLEALAAEDAKAAAEVAQTASETAEKFERSVQRMSDQLTTHIGGISAQIGQLIMKSGRGE